MKKELFRGVGTALVTPFKDGKVDYALLSALVEYQIKHGADALIICGTTGEAPTLSALEKLKCISKAAEVSNGRVPIIAGSTTNDTDFSCRLSRLVCKEGADGVLAVMPYYNKPTPSGVADHFLKIAESCGKHIVVYNVPSRTGSEVSDGVYDRLIAEGLDFSIKEASGSVSRALDIIHKYGDETTVYSGNDDLTLPLLSIGARGVISVVSNILPLEMHIACQKWFDGQYEESRKLFHELLPITRALFAEPNPIPIKAAMNMCGFCGDEIRLPLTNAKADTVERIRTALDPLMSL